MGVFLPLSTFILALQKGCFFLSFFVLFAIYLIGDNMFVYENGVLKVIGYRKLISVDENQIIIDMKNIILSVIGINLTICFFDKNEIDVKGIIENVRLGYDK